MIRVAINGFGRVGRAFFRLSAHDPDIEVVAVHDRFEAEELAYLLKYDSVHGKFPGEVDCADDALVVGGKTVQVCKSKRFRRLPWNKMKVDVVVEATGGVRTVRSARRHLSAGAKKVLITRIPKKETRGTIPMFLFGVNEEHYHGERIVSGASCSANCAAPILKVLHEALSVRYGTMTAVHAYTMDQRILDSGHKGDLRRGRAAALNIVPSASKAARVVSQLVPGLDGKLMGSTIRVPTADGSLMNIVCRVEKPVNIAEVNEILKHAAETGYYGILEYSAEPLVSRDTVNNPHSAIIDSLSTRILPPSFLRVVAWYDHEWGYAARLVDLVKHMALAPQKNKKKRLFTTRAVRYWLSHKLMRFSPEASLRLYPAKSLSIEASSACNIHCLCCPVGNKAIEGHTMPLDAFKRIIDLLPSHVKRLDFSHRGDPTMNPQFPKMVNYAHKRGLTTDVYTNGLILDRYIPELVESGLDILRVDLDGASAQSYLKYRIGSDFEKVKSNIRLLVEARARSKGKFPRKIYIICVVSAFNEHEISEIQSMAESMGVEKLLFKTAIINYGAKYYHAMPEQQKRIVPLNKAYRRGVRPKGFVCKFLWQGAILYNGDLQVCTADFEGEYILGNILKENSFEKVYYSRKANTIRKQVIKLDGLCKECAVVGKNHYIPDISKTYKGNT